MNSIRFEWDEKKAKSNKKKHGVSFEEAQTVFFDEHARVMYDPDHSEEEDRFVILGMSSSLRVIVVCHCLRENDELIRIISSRKADKDERKTYGEFWT